MLWLHRFVWNNPNTTGHNRYRKTNGKQQIEINGTTLTQIVGCTGQIPGTRFGRRCVQTNLNCYSSSPQNRRPNTPSRSPHCAAQIDSLVTATEPIAGFARWCTFSEYFNYCIETLHLLWFLLTLIEYLSQRCSSSCYARLDQYGNKPQASPMCRPWHWASMWCVIRNSIKRPQSNNGQG